MPPTSVLAAQGNRFILVQAGIVEHGGIAGARHARRNTIGPVGGRSERPCGGSHPVKVLAFAPLLVKANSTVLAAEMISARSRCVRCIFVCSAMSSLLDERNVLSLKSPEKHVI